MKEAGKCIIMEDGNRKVEEEIDTKIIVSNVPFVINCIIQLMSATPNMDSFCGTKGKMKE